MMTYLKCLSCGAIVICFMSGIWVGAFTVVFLLFMALDLVLGFLGVALQFSFGVTMVDVLLPITWIVWMFTAIPFLGGAVRYERLVAMMQGSPSHIVDSQ